MELKDIQAKIKIKDVLEVTVKKDARFRVSTDEKPSWEPFIKEGYYSWFKMKSAPGDKIIGRVGYISDPSHCIDGICIRDSKRSIFIAHIAIYSIKKYNPEN